MHDASLVKCHTFPGTQRIRVKQGGVSRYVEQGRSFHTEDAASKFGRDTRNGLDRCLILSIGH